MRSLVLLDLFSERSELIVHDQNAVNSDGDPMFPPEPSEHVDVAANFCGFDLDL